MDMRTEAVQSARSNHGFVAGMNDFEYLCFAIAKAKEIQRVA